MYGGHYQRHPAVVQAVAAHAANEELLELPLAEGNGPPRVTRYDREIDMGDRYGRLIWEIGHQCDIDRDIDMEYVLSIWDLVYRYGYLPYR
jgi:hypothetical protein